MGKTLTKPKSDLGIEIRGTATNHNVTLDHEQALQQAFGTDFPEMAESLLRHCLKMLKANESSEDYAGNDEREFMLAAVAELKPRDTVERMLAVQMAATHVAMVRSARWLANSERIDQVNAHYNGYNKLARTYAAQVEALRKHRNGGKQTVTVQHVNVSDGGQAIVGNVGTGGRASDGK
ncbi:hypothetical protein [Ruegeria arenilitoris]|uniref:hypothetical protein n=1 Tax=Ruegeria arenilitoris TaxID=1173585 RepID=UPI003C7D4687